MTNNNLIKTVVKSIFKAVPITEHRWREKIILDRGNPSVSSVSDWKNGKTAMRAAYRTALIQALVDQEELRLYENDIRDMVIKELQIPQYCRSYYQLADKTYEDFLKIVLFQMTPDFIQDQAHHWSAVQIPLLMKLTAAKIQIMEHDIRFSAEVPEGSEDFLILSYEKAVHHEMSYFQVTVSVLFGEYTPESLVLYCENCHKAFCEYGSKSVVNILFVNSKVPDEVYLKIIKTYQIVVRQIDAFDVEAVHSYRSYVPVLAECHNEETMRFLNNIAEVLIEKICGMHHLILKEIICRNYDISKVGQGYFSSNAGMWEYKYPIRRALAFEEDILDEKLKEYARRGLAKSVELLDINLTGALYGLRLSSRVKRVTCVDMAGGSVCAIERIIQQYNYTKADRNKGIQNVQTGYLRIDSQNLLGVNMPETGYDIIILGLGSASYIDDLAGFLRKITSWLKEGGTFFLSAYNKDALCRYSDQLENMDFTYNGCYFRHQGGRWYLPATLYSYTGFRNAVQNHFDVKNSYSYPTMLSLISAGQDHRLLEKLKEMDKLHSRNAAFGSDSGMFNMVCTGEYDKQGIVRCFQEICEYLKRMNITVSRINHEYITSRDMMLRVLNDQGIRVEGNFIKTLLVYDGKNGIYFFMVLPLEKNFSRSKLKQWYRKNPKYLMVNSKIHFCSEVELKEFGLASGSLSPFSYPVIRKIKRSKKRKRMVLLYDRELTTTEGGDIYTYSGNLGITYRLSRSALLEYLRKENGIIFG